MSWIIILKEFPQTYIEVLPQCLAVREAMEDLRIVLDAAPKEAN